MEKRLPGKDSESYLPNYDWEKHIESLCLPMMLRSIPCMLKIKDDQNRILAAKGATEQFFGLSPDRLKGRFVSDLFDPQEAKRIHTLDLEVFKTGQPIPGETQQYQREDGTTVWSIADRTPVYNQAGDVVAVAVYERDITDLIRTHQRLEYEYTFARRLFDHSPNGIVQLDPENRIEQANPTFCEMFGYAEEEILGQDLNVLIAPGERLVEARNITTRTSQGEAVSLETVRCRKDRSLIAVGVRAVPLIVNKELVGKYCLYQDITDRVRKERKIRHISKRNEILWRRAIHLMAATIEARDPYTAGHHRRVSHLSYKIAQELDLDRELVDRIPLAALIHDIGKTSIPIEILSKPGRLNDMEFKLVKAHPETGFKIIQHYNFPTEMENVVLQHHERLDGSGYPKGLKGDEISLEACIVGVADVVEAMSTHRPYRPALPLEDALKEIQSQSGVLYHPDIVEACLRVFDNGFEFPEK